MTDLYVGIAIMVVLYFATYRATVRLLRRLPGRWADVLAVCTMLGMCLYLQYLWDNIRIAHLVPLSNVVIVGNWFPLLASVLAACAWRSLTGHRFRQIFAFVAMSGIGGYAMLYPLLGAPPECDDHWRGEICLQTSIYTCSAASCATLLRGYGIETTEAEMARLCLTRQGTTWLGLYHGLSIRLRKAGYRPDLFGCSPEALRDVCKDGPVLLCCELTPDAADRFPQFETRFGWHAGVKHSVVLFGFTGGGFALIGDPAVGLEAWSPGELYLLWQRQGIRVI